MKRLHLHVSVEDIDKSIKFYSTLFGQEASVVKDDYAKWLLDDPAVNFAISNRGSNIGLNHLGFQVDDDEQLQAITDRLNDAEIAGMAEAGANCCYAKSDKYWTKDPANIPWENFRTLGDIPLFGEDHGPEPVEDGMKASGAACCN